MKQWEPIAGKDVQVGDRITWGSRSASYEVLSISGDYWIGTNQQYPIESDLIKMHTAYTFQIRDLRGVFRFIQHKDYDPTQQPYDEGDI